MVYTGLSPGCPLKEHHMKFKSPLIASASGSLAGITASRNKGGQYFRRRAVPTNPNSTYQQAVRGYLNTLSNLWLNTLTAAQRVAWDTYAANVPLLNPLGDPINVTGLNMYVRSNVALLQAAMTRVDDAPTTFNLGDYTNPSFAYDATASEIDVTFDNTDAWANEDDAAMLVYGSRQQGASVIFFKGPYRFAGTIDGDSATPPTSPAAISAPFPAVAGNNCHCRIVVVRADGRVSMPFRGVGLSA